MTGSDPLYPKYKKIRNRIRKYTPASLLEHSLAALREAHLGGVEVIAKYQPWKVFLIAKWVIEEADELAHRRTVAGRNELHGVYNDLFRMEDDGWVPSDFSHLTFFMRQLAYQQFWLKWMPDAAALARQELLFATLPPNHPFQLQFKQLTGLSIGDYTVLSFALIALVMHKPLPRAVSRKDFVTAGAQVAPEAIDAFLANVGKSVTQLRLWFGSEEFEGELVSDQMLLPTPLLEAPLLVWNSTYFIWYPALVLQAMQSVVYRTLRNADPAEFGNRFGKVFEKYLARCFDDAGVQYWDERRMIAALPGTGKCVDFLTVDTDCTVLIDAKAMEMSRLGRVARTADAVLRAAKDSFVKAAGQGLDSARRLKNGGHGIPLGAGETFLVVVTFGDLYLGTSQEFGQLFGDRLVPKLEEEFGNPLPVPVENMFFVSVDELERLLSRVHQRKTTIVAALRHAREQDRDHKTRKMHFQQHLDTLCEQTDRLPLLQKTFVEIVDRCRGRLFPNAADKAQG